MDADRPAAVVVVALIILRSLGTSSPKRPHPARGGRRASTRGR
jgi:hypothetical protein